MNGALLKLLAAFGALVAGAAAVLIVILLIRDTLG
jgi:hypothetical protein